MTDDTPTCDEAISWKVTAEQVAAILDEVRAERDEARAENIRLRAAAPAVEGYVSCEHFHDVVPTLHGTGCPGPHRTLLLGPEVTR